MLFLSEDAKFRFEASFNTPPELAEHQHQRGLFKSLPGAVLDAVLQTMQVVHTVDKRREAIPGPSVALGGAKTHMAVPMLKGTDLVGAIVIYRREILPFTAKQIELVQNFAAQAVIAIENTRLLNELRETLDRQTATSEVLGIISSSPGELQPVFDAVLANATRICEASFGTLMVREGNAFRRVALHNAPLGYLEFAERTPLLPLSDHPSLIRIVETQIPHQIADMSQAEPHSPISKLGQARTLMNVPMLKDGALVGVIGIYRREIRPFSDKQLDLVSNFAAQAVIAIENTRLLNVLRQRTDNLSEALEQQTATSEVLRVISSSPGDLSPVFHTMLENARRICGAEIGLLLRHNDGAFTVAAETGPRRLLPNGGRAVRSFAPVPTRCSAA
jgi:two-component system NtrC family sensor kinase